MTRSVAILRLLARSREPLGVNAIARELAMVPSTCLHILRALVGEELVAVDPATKRYVLDAGVLTLARSALRQDGFVRFAQPELDALASKRGVTAIGVRVIGLQHMIVVGISRSEATFRLHVDVGSRFPALISATGRCLAAFGNHSEREIARAFRALRWDAAPSYADWQTEIAETRAAGFGVDRGNYLRGVTIVAAPVIGIEGWMTHALVAVALSDQLPPTGASAIGAELRTAAARVTAQLGGADVHGDGS
ncbi:MAG: IclR family transcriptional regulator [Hyphomicrobiaceae bacterium]|nr:IclR family transcriptional regulator [Hyphomicrobiaceae bacterium]